MKFIVAVFLCLLSTVGFAAQTGNNGYVETKKEQTKPTLSMAKEDSEGNIVENINIFAPGDIPIYCYIDLNSTKSVTVKLNFVAVKVRGIRPNHKIIRASYKTKNDEDSVTFLGEPDKLWLVGEYRVDIFIDDKLAISKGFVVEKSKPKK